MLGRADGVGHSLFRRAGAPTGSQPHQDATPQDSRAEPVEPKSPKPHHWVRKGAALGSLALVGFGGAAVALPNSAFPAPLSTAAHLVTSTLSGETTIPAPGLPAFPALSQQQITAAEARGQGASVSEPVIQDPQGHYHEPVTIIVDGSLSTLQSLLEKEGWSPPGIIPMSTMLVNGHPAVLSLVKNSEVGGLSRDHLRIYNLGVNPATGQQQWGIAASRDLDPEVELSPDGGLSFHHAVAHDLDGERALVVHDLLAANPQLANTMKVVHGVRTYNNNGDYQTDGNVYEFSL